MKLFRLDAEYEIEPEQETILLVPEFKVIWSLAYNKQEGDRDGRSRKRGRAELVYLYFYCDYRSEFSELSDVERKEAAMDSAGLNPDYTLSGELGAARDKYIELQETRELKLLNSAYGVVDKLRLYFEQIEITDTNSKSTIDNLSKLGPVLAGVKKLEDQVRKAQGNAGKARGGGERGFLDA